MRKMHEDHIRRVAEARKALEIAKYELDERLLDAAIDGPLPGDELDCWVCGTTCTVVDDSEYSLRRQVEADCPSWKQEATISESFAQKHWLNGWQCGC